MAVAPRGLGSNPSSVTSWLWQSIHLWSSERKRNPYFAEVSWRSNKIYKPWNVPPIPVPVWSPGVRESEKIWTQAKEIHSSYAFGSMLGAWERVENEANNTFAFVECTGQGFLCVLTVYLGLRDGMITIAWHTSQGVVRIRLDDAHGNIFVKCKLLNWENYY